MVRTSSRAARTGSDDDDFKPPAVPGRGSRNPSRQNSSRRWFPELVPDTVARAPATTAPSEFDHDVLEAKRNAAGMSTSAGTAGLARRDAHGAVAALGATNSDQDIDREYCIGVKSRPAGKREKYVEEEKSEIPYTCDEPTSAVVRPGAVAVGGAGFEAENHHSSYRTASPPVQDSRQNMSHQEQEMALAAEVVPEEADVEAQVDARVRQQTDQIAARVRKTLIQEAVHADVVADKKPPQQSLSSCGRHKKWWIFGGAVAIIVALVVVLIVLLVPKKESSDEPTVPSTPTVSPLEPTNSPAEPPGSPTSSPATTGPVNPTRLSALQERLAPVVGDVFSDQSSPQYAALQWLADADPANLPVESTPLPTLKNRFVFATLYFAMNGSSWTNQYNFLSADEVCNWNSGSTGKGITCDAEDLGIEVSLENNGLSGSLPEEIMQLGDLVKLDADDNLITGTIPESIGSLSILETLDLSGNKFRGTLPSQIFDLPKLESINVWSNAEISGTIPQNIGNAVSLRILFLGANSITGTIPSSVNNLQSLEAFVIAFNNLSGSIPNLENSSQLHTIFLDSNIKLSGSIPASIGNLPRLRRFTASNNALTGKVPSFAGNSGTLEELWLYENLLTGISEFFETAATASLKVVQCHNNRFQDFLTSRIGQFRDLRIIDISDNLMIGTIPTEVGLLPIQAYDGVSDDEGSFDVGNNQMTGTIPTELGLLTTADRIDVGKNLLNGTIPSELGKCVQLNTLDVRFNELQGTVPTEIAALPLLDRFFVSGNNGITGNLDTLFCSRPTPFTNIASDCLREDVTCSCCDICCASSDPISCEEMRL